MRALVSRTSMAPRRRVPRRLLICAKPLANLGAEQPAPLQRSERLEPLAHRLGGLIFEESLQRVAEALARQLGGPELARNVDPNRHRGVSHAFIMHWHCTPRKLCRAMHGTVDASGDVAAKGEPARVRGRCAGDWRRE